MLERSDCIGCSGESTEFEFEGDFILEEFRILDNAGNFSMAEHLHFEVL